ncbi:MAG: class I SAM-dependent methyltransferase [Burkholderiaceae bacterium]
MKNRWSLQIFLCLAVSLGFACTSAIARDISERYRSVPANADGIGKSYMGRQIAHVMGWQGAAWLEREERECEERSDLLLRIFAPAPGSTVADVGAGSGYYSRRIADAIGTTGKVYAIDVQPEMFAMLQSVAKQRGYGHITPLLGAANDVKLPAASVDVAIMVDVYHELEFPYEVLASIVRAVKPGGRVVFVEYRAEDPRVPIKRLHKMSEAQIRREAEVHSLLWERTANDLPWQHVVIFKRP